MDEKRQKTNKYDSSNDHQLDGSKLQRLTRPKKTVRLKLDGNVARRVSLKVGVTWDIELPGFGLRKRSHGKVTWVVKYRYRGQQRMKTLGAARVVTAHTARAKARQLIAEAALVGLPTKPKQKHVPRFDEYVHEFWRDYAQHWKPTTQKACPEFLERDKVSINSFGLGFDENRVPYLVVFYRYLSTLNAEHQRYWDSFRAEKSVPMCKQYFDSSVAGEWWENRSLRYAIQEEIRLINEMSEAAFSIQLFRYAMSDDIPIDVTAFSIPSKDNFHQFVHNWDKILSENINKKFFRGKIALEDEVERKDGKVIVTQRGTLKLLQEWLEKVVRSSQKAELIDEITAPITIIPKPMRIGPANGLEKEPSG